MENMPEPKTKEDIKNMLKHIEDEHRKANITEQTYKELKAKYKEQMKYMDNVISPEEAGGPPAAEAPAPPAEAPAEEAPKEEVKEEPKEEKKEEKKGGLLKKVFKGKKEEKKESAPPAEAPAEAAASSRAMDKLSIELEKLKAMLEAIRDQKKASDESIQSIFESIGEIRSMSIQTNADESELSSKMERLEDEVSGVRPKEMEKKFNELREALNKSQTEMEKMIAKTNDMAQRLNKLYENMKSIGNIENLANLNKDVQKKLGDIREATNYVERLSSKTEKMFIDLKAGMEEMIIYRSKQEGLEESVRDLIKSVDDLGLKFENYSTKKDLQDEKQDLMIISKELDGLKDNLGILQSKVPETITVLRKEREDIQMFLDHLDEQLKAGAIQKIEYENVKTKNMDKLKLLDNSLREEWKKFEKAMATAPKETTPPAEAAVETTKAPDEPPVEAAEPVETPEEAPPQEAPAPPEEAPVEAAKEEVKEEKKEEKEEPKKKHKKKSAEKKEEKDDGKKKKVATTLPF